VISIRCWLLPVAKLTQDVILSGFGTKIPGIVAAVLAVMNTA